MIVVRFLKAFIAAFFDAWDEVRAEQHTLAHMTRNPDGSMDIVCKSGCKSRLRVVVMPSGVAQTIGDRLKVESTNCPLYIAFRRKHGQEPGPMPDANLN